MLAASLCLPLAAGSVAAAAAGSAPAPARHRFGIAVTTTSGRLAGRRGRATVLLRTGAGTSVRALRLVFQGDRCHGASACVALTGTLRGTITVLPGDIPDLGRQFRVDVHGRLSPLGRVSVTGTVLGTGFIATGHESLQLTVHAAHGTLGLDGQSATVPGFTSP